MSLPTTDVVAALAHRLAPGSRRSVPRLRGRRADRTRRSRTRPSGWLAHFAGDAGSGRGDRVATLLENCPEQVVRFFAAVQARCDPGADQHRLQGRVPAPRARRLAAPGWWSSRRIWPTGSWRFAGEPTPDLSCTAVVVGDPKLGRLGADHAPAWNDALAARADDSRDCPRSEVGPADLACFIYTAGTTGPSKGCMLPHRLRRGARRADRPRLGRAARRRRSSRRCRCSTSTRSRCASSARCSWAGARRSRGKFSVSRFWPEVQRTGRHDALDARLARDPHRERRRPPRPGRAPAAAVRGRADAARHRPHLARAVRLRDVQRRATGSPRRR